MKNLALYIDIPFCKQKCKYCDFPSFANCENLIPEYIRAVKTEILNYKNKFKNYLVTSIYFGGGTPSYIESQYISKIFEAIYENFKTAKDLESTIEINPGTINEEKLKEYRRCKINRLSIGLQTADDKLLKDIGRIHNYEQFLEGIELARKIGFSNINADVMFGLPNQEITQLEDTIEKLISLDLKHISCYSLKIEKSTQFYKMAENGELNIPSEEIEREMYYLIKNRLKDKYIHYEISNFAQEGFESNHNLAYWGRKDYLGIGSSSASCIDDIRFSNECNLKKYIEKISNKISPIVYKEELDDEEILYENIILGLRLKKGINYKDLLKNESDYKKEKFENRKNKLIKYELLEEKGGIIRLSKRGLDLANQVFVELDIRD